MRPPEEVKQEMVKQWLKTAESDLAAAKLLLSAGGSFYYIVGFHAQQAAEKYLKAYLTHHQIEFPETHDLKEILALVATKDSRLADSMEEAIILTDYAVEPRYPGDFPDPTMDQAKEALRLAGKLERLFSRNYNQIRVE